jgi:hypothetical protein
MTKKVGQGNAQDNAELLKKTRQVQDKTRQIKTRQDKTRQDKAR